MNKKVISVDFGATSIYYAVVTESESKINVSPEIQPYPNDAKPGSVSPTRVSGYVVEAVEDIVSICKKERPHGIAILTQDAGMRGASKSAIVRARIEGAFLAHLHSEKIPVVLMGGTVTSKAALQTKRKGGYLDLDEFRNVENWANVPAVRRPVVQFGVAALSKI